MVLNGRLYTHQALDFFSNSKASSNASPIVTSFKTHHFLNVFGISGSDVLMFSWPQALPFLRVFCSSERVSAVIGFTPSPRFGAVPLVLPGFLSPVRFVVSLATLCLLLAQGSQLIDHGLCYLGGLLSGALVDNFGQGQAVVIRLAVRRHNLDIAIENGISC